MHTKNFFTAFDIWVAHGDLTVKPARTQQCRVEHVFTVGRRDDDDALVGLKTVHLNQQLVQCLFTFVITTAHANTTCATNGVNLVDENDAGRVFLGLLEHVAHTGCTDTDKHFNEVRTGNRKERHTCFARNRTRQQCFTRTGRADKQRTFGNLTTKARKFLRVAQEFNDLF